MLRILNRLKLNQNSKGFSLVEMMIVISIIALIMGFAITKIVRKYDEARVEATKIQIKQLSTILDDYRRVCGTYPTTEQGLDALAKAPTSGRMCKNYDPDGFIKKVPKDAWNNDFVYISDGNKVTIKSLGADGKEGGEGFDKDISSEDMD